MAIRVSRVWRWVHVSFTTLIRFGIVAAAFVFAYGRWGSWEAAIASLAMLTVMAPVVIILICTLLPEPNSERARRLVANVYRAGLVLLLCLLVASLTTRLVGLSILCAICALWTGLFYALFKMASDARSI